MLSIPYPPTRVCNFSVHGVGHRSYIIIPGGGTVCWHCLVYCRTIYGALFSRHVILLTSEMVLYQRDNQRLVTKQSFHSILFTMMMMMMNEFEGHLRCYI